MVNAPWLHVREAVGEDVLALHELYTVHLTKRPPAQRQDISRWARLLQQLVDDPNYYILIGETEYKIVSSATLVVVPNLTNNLRPYGLIENVVTHASHRNRGYAGEVLRRAGKIAKERDCYKVMLMTGSKLESTLNFYEKCGFSQHEKTAFIKRF